MIHAGGAPRVFPLPRGGSLVVGRDPAADVPIADLTVSRLHARITIDDEGPCVEELGSRNGTSVDGLTLAAGESRRAHASSALTFGHVQASFARMRAYDRVRLAVRAEEHAMIVAALRRTEGHQGEAARLLGISRRGLINKMEAFGLERPRKGKSTLPRA